MRLVLFILCIAELLLYSFCQNIAGPFVTPCLILAVSVSVAFVSLNLARTPRIETGSPLLKNTWLNALSATMFLALSVWIFAELNKGFQAVSMYDTNSSDVMLTYIHIVKNFTNGRPAYEPFFNISYVIAPAYLPFQWMPYVLAEYLHFDYRWVAVTCLWLASLFFFVKNRSRQSSRSTLFATLVIPLWPLIVFITLIKFYVFNFLITLESLVAAYYLLLGIAIGSKRWILMAVCIALCMLSRMSIVFWIPLCLGCYFVAGERKTSFIIAGICMVFAIGCIGPFLLTNRGFLSNPYHTYSAAIEGIWAKHETTNGLSVNIWAMNFLPGDTHQKVSLYNNIHLAVCSLTSLALGLCFLRFRKKYTLNSYLLFSLKIYLTVFYNFIQLSFDYLYIVPLMITASLLANAVVPQTTKNRVA